MVRISILVLCYNHEAFLDQALNSLLALQAGVEILVADDASSDRSPQLLRRWQERCPHWQFVFHDENKGNCATFNELLALAKGDWILDFASDDLLIPEMLLPWAEKADSFPDCGFCYADAFIFSRKNGPFQKFSAQRKDAAYPEGNILQAVFSPGLICPPAVLFLRRALQQLGGYNQQLSYEDLDIWLRIAREFPVCHFPEPVIKYRKHPASMSAAIYQGANRRHIQSTLQLLNGALLWPEFQPVPESLTNFIRYHLRLCFFLQLPEEAVQFYDMMKKSQRAGWRDWLLCWLSGKCPGISELYGLVHQGRLQWREAVLEVFRRKH